MAGRGGASSPRAASARAWARRTPKQYPPPRRRADPRRAPLRALRPGTPACAGVVVAAPAGARGARRGGSLGAAPGAPAAARSCAGGADRQESVWLGAAGGPGRRRVRAGPRRGAAVHHRARSSTRVLAAAGRDGAAICALPIAETVKRVRDGRGGGDAGPDGALGRADAAGLPRARCCARRTTRRGATASWAPTTPMLVERLGRPVRVVPGLPGRTSRSPRRRICRRGAGRAERAMTESGLDSASTCIRWWPAGRSCWAASPCRPTLGLGGHSDADVLTHAIGEALLGALALGRPRPAFPGHRPALPGHLEPRAAARR